MNGKRVKALRKQALLYVGVNDIKEMKIPGKRECKEIYTKPDPDNKTDYPRFLGYKFRIGKPETVTDIPTIIKYTYKALKKYYKKNFIS